MSLLEKFALFKRSTICSAWLRVVVMQNTVFFDIIIFLFVCCSMTSEDAFVLLFLSYVCTNLLSDAGQWGFDLRLRRGLAKMETSDIRPIERKFTPSPSSTKKLEVGKNAAAATDTISFVTD
jgi:hypothetical protein